MSVYISQNLRSQIELIGRKRCCYCLTTEANSGMPMTIDHIQSVSKGGLNTTGAKACGKSNDHSLTAKTARFENNLYLA